MANIRLFYCCVLISVLSSSAKCQSSLSEEEFGKYIMGTIRIVTRGLTAELSKFDEAMETLNGTAIGYFIAKYTNEKCREEQSNANKLLQESAEKFYDPQNTNATKEIIINELKQVWEPIRNQIKASQQMGVEEEEITKESMQNVNDKFKDVMDKTFLMILKLSMMNAFAEADKSSFLRKEIKNQNFTCWP